MESPTSDEKLLAAMAHASVLLSFFGPIGAALVWVIQRNKSNYVRYHALQAMGYQVFSFWIWLLFGFVTMFGFVILMMVLGFILGDEFISPPSAIFILQPIIMLAIFGTWGLMFVFGFVGAVFCMLGKDFRYPFIGNWLQNKVLNAQSEEEAERWEDFWVSSVCHASAILQLWGMITPFIVWFSQKERSARLRFQSLQSGLYQLIITAGYILSFAGIFIMYIIVIAMLIMGGSPSDPQQAASPVFTALIMIFMAIFMIIWLFWVVFYPIYYILAAIASIRTLRGHDFKYPILGSLLQRIKTAQKLEGGAS